MTFRAELTIALTVLATCVGLSSCAGGGGGSAIENEAEVSVGDGPKNVRVSWLPPEQNEDGSEFSDLQEYRVYITADGVASGYVRTASAALVVTGLPEGEAAFNVTAVNVGGNESIPSEQISIESR